MKKYALLLLSLAFCFVCFVQCKREVADFRIKYLGDYNFIIHETSCELGQTTDTLYSFHGEVSKSGSGSNIFINYSADRNFEITLQEDGSFNTHYPTSCIFISGKFESPSKIKLSYYLSYGNGLYRFNEDITGNKKE